MNDLLDGLDKLHISDRGGVHLPEGTRSRYNNRRQNNNIVLSDSYLSDARDEGDTNDASINNDLIDGVSESSDNNNSSSSSDWSEEDENYINWFCNLRGNEFFCKVERDFITDDFNLTDLRPLLGQYYDYALDTILDIEFELPHDAKLTEKQQDQIDLAAEMLYGLIHARYILTTRGMEQMYTKYEEKHFGRCYRVLCQGQPVLPLGLADIPRSTTINTYCPNCRQVYFPKSTKQGNIDGAYFGTTFAHLFLILYPNLIPVVPLQTYTPRVYGFKIHGSSDYWKGTEQHKWWTLRNIKEVERDSDDEDEEIHSSDG